MRGKAKTLFTVRIAVVPRLLHVGRLALLFAVTVFAL